MLLYLVNPSNPLISISLNRGSYWNRFRLWKPLGLLVLAGLTPPDWEIVILDENLAAVDYAVMPRARSRRHHRFHIAGATGV